MNTRTKKQRKKAVFEQEHRTILPVCLWPTTEASNTVTPHGSLFCPAQRTGPPHPRSAPSLGSGHPCPGSETLFLVLTRRGWRAGFWSWVAWVPVQGHLSGHVTSDKSLHFLACAMSVAIVCVSRGFGQSLNSGQSTHTDTFCVYSLFPCPGFPGSALSTFRFLPLKTNTLPGPRSHSCLSHERSCLIWLLPLTLSGHLPLSPLRSSHTECITVQGEPDIGLEPRTG